jgi:hypothetical protein
MDQSQFEPLLEETWLALAEIDGVLAAWGKRIVDLRDPRWSEKLQESHPFARDEALRDRFDSALRRLAALYEACDPGQRARIRDLIRDLTGARNAVGVSAQRIRSAEDTELFRFALICESLKDLGRDSRDAIVALDGLCDAARQAGIDPRPYLEEVAALCGDIDHYGMGSMRALMLSRAKR